MAEVGILEYKPDIDGNRKRKKLFGDERLHRNRERNRMHARKTRERKKQQSNALQSRLTELEAEGNKLRQIVDDRYTASVLLGLSQTFQNSLGENHNILSSATVCSRATISLSLCNSNESNSSVGSGSGDAEDNKDHNVVAKRVRRRGKYTSQERERIRRERNRMHAKRTRDRKKKLLEDSESIIVRMERESHLLRGYCVSLNMLSAEDAVKFEERASESKRELAALKASQGEYDVDCDEDDDNDYNNNDDNGDGDDEHDNDGSLSGSDDNEKSCSWNGSNNGNESINGNDSINGDTSGDARSSGSNSRSDGSSTHNSNSSSSSNDSNNIGSGSSGSNSSNSHNSGSGSGSGSGSDSPVPKHAKKDWKEKEESGFEKGFNYGTKPPNTKPSGVYKAQHTDNRQHTQHANAYPTHIPTHISSTHSDVASSQSMESYNHGGVAPGHTDYSAPNPSMIVLEIKATLAAADYFKSQNTAPPQWSYPQTHPAHPAPVPAQETYSLSIGPHLNVPYHPHASHPTAPMHTMQTALHPLVHPLALTHPLALHPIHPTHATHPTHGSHGSHVNHKNQIHPTKVKNILLSVIPPGISAPRGPGGTSPQGLFTPVPTLLSSNSYPNSQAIHRQQQLQLQQLSDHTNNGLGGTTPHRNLPPSNSNVPEPL